MYAPHEPCMTMVVRQVRVLVSKEERGITGWWKWLGDLDL